MNNWDKCMKDVAENIANVFKNNKSNSAKIYENLRKAQLKQFRTKELMDELRRRGKTVGKKGIR